MNRKTAESILEELNKLYPHTEDDINFLQFRNPFEILIMTILSAQTTDVIINSIRDELFEKYPDAQALSQANQVDVEKIIHSAGYYHAKAKNIIATSKMLCEKFNGVVPDTIEELILLPGVGRKTANIVTNHAFHKTLGIAVDTHVGRLSQKIGFSNNTTPEKIEQDLMKLFDKKDWYQVNFLLISHGRAVCNAKKQDCSSCTIRNMCKSNNS
ncbi:MAG: endonuclease III [Methanocorpusculum sp.]|nr:endonuclease III [Methanocorpusculum sp.]